MKKSQKKCDEEKTKISMKFVLRETNWWIIKQNEQKIIKSFRENRKDTFLLCC